MRVVVNEMLIQYEQTGKGKIVLFLHGWGDSSAGFSELATVLSQNGYSTVRVDLPGFGQSQAPTGVWGLSDYAMFVRDFLKKIDATPYAIIGHSNGGAIALRGLAENSLTSSKLVLLSSAGIRGTYKGRLKALRLITKAGKLLVSPLPASTKQKLRRKVYAAVGSDMLVAEHLQETFKKVVTDDVRADVAKLSLPTLLVYGLEDTATPVEFGKIFSESIAGSRLEIIEGAGHFVHHDQPVQVASLVKEFLQ